MADPSVDTESELAVLDGKLMPAAEAMIPAGDAGFLRGDGVFEVFRVYDGRPFGLEEHLQRLLRSAHGIRLPEMDPVAITRDVNVLTDARGRSDYGVRVVITRGGHRLVVSEPIADFLPSVRMSLVEYQPSLILDGLKTLSYGANMQANRVAQERGYDEALLVTPAGEVLESPTATLFWSADGETLITPPLEEGILASITRAVLVDGMTVSQRKTTSDELATATEAFLCSSVREVQAVSEIEGHQLSVPGKLTLRATTVLGDAVQARLAAGAPNQV